MTLAIALAAPASAELACPLRACPSNVDRCLSTEDARHLRKACKRRLRKACRRFLPEGTWVFEGVGDGGPFADTFTIRADGSTFVVDQPWVTAGSVTVDRRSFEISGIGGLPRYTQQRVRLSTEAVVRGRASAQFEYESHWLVGPPPGVPPTVVVQRTGAVARVLCPSTTTTVVTTSTTTSTSTTTLYGASLQPCGTDLDSPVACPAQGLCASESICLPEPSGQCHCHPRCGTDLMACGGACPTGTACSAAMGGVAGGCVCL